MFCWFANVLYFWHFKMVCKFIATNSISDFQSFSNFPNFSKMLSILNNFYLSWHTWKTFSACKLWTIYEEVFHLKMFLECVKHSRETNLNLKSDMKFVKIMQTLVTTLKHYEWENHRTWSDMSKWGRRRRRNWFAIECLLFIPVVFSLCYQGE